MENLFDPKLYAQIYANVCHQNDVNMDSQTFGRDVLPWLAEGQQVLVTFEIVNPQPIPFVTNLQFVKESV